MILLFSGILKLNELNIIALAWILYDVVTLIYRFNDLSAAVTYHGGFYLVVMVEAHGQQNAATALIMHNPHIKSDFFK